MNWVVNYVLPTLITVVSGVLVFLFGELLNTIWLKPLLDFKHLKGDIAKHLLFYANVYTNVLDASVADGDWKKLHSEASNKLRWLASELEGFLQTLSWLKIGIPKKANLKEAASLLILLSNSMFDSCQHTQNRENRNVANKIRCLLKIYGYKK